MIAVVHQTFGDVIFADSCFFVYLTAFQNHFVTYEAGGTPINDAVCVFEARSQVIGTQDGYLRGTGQPFRSHHADVPVGDGQNACTAERSTGYLIGRIAEHLVSRQERHQMLGHTDRAYARSAATVRRSKRFMQVQVAYVRPDKAGIRQAYLCIHVGTVHIYLRTASVDDVADFYDLRFEDAVCRGIGDHQSGKVILVLFCFGAKVGHVYIALFVAGTSHGGEACLDGRCRIGSVCGCRYQYLAALSLSDAFKVGTDHTKSCIFACRTGVRLQADAGKAGDYLQFFTEVAY